VRATLNSENVKNRGKEQGKTGELGVCLKLLR